MASESIYIYSILAFVAIEYALWAYMQHRPDVIYLMGLPDNKASQAAHEQFKAHLKYSMAYRKIESRLKGPGILRLGHDLGVDAKMT
mgnify:CR=1 FL=1